MKTKIKNKKTKIQEAKELLILIIVAFTIKTCLIEIYVVPTPSMEKTILVGDMLIGNKFIYGMRTPNWIGIPYTRLGFYIPSFRLPKFKEVKEGDVVIFEFPRDPFQKYVKRCMGLPGDKIKIENGEVFRNSKKIPLPIEGQYTTKGNSDITIYEKSKFNPASYAVLQHIPFQKNINKNIVMDTAIIRGMVDTRSLYPLFSEELIEPSFSRNNYNEKLYYDRNGNNKIDYGNEDNIEEFTVPFKDQEIDFEKNVNWKHVINLLLLDGCNIEVKVDNKMYKFDIESSFERSRLSGIVKFELLKILYLFTGQDEKISNLNTAKSKELTENWLELEKKKKSKGFINPWHLTLTYDIKDNPMLTFFDDITQPNFNIYSIDEKIYTTSGEIIPEGEIKNQIDNLFEIYKSNLISFSPYENLYINGVQVSPSFKYKLKNDYYFLIGDNRNQSSDCRFWGFVPDYHILGTPVYAAINVHNPIKNIRFKPIK